MTYTINRLGHAGDGIADGPLYAARTLPGEIVNGPIEGDRIQSPKIINPSADRVRPACPAYNRCGGCALQHAADPFVSGWKSQMVRVALESRNLSAPIRNQHQSPANSRRRAKFQGRRTKKAATVGFHAPRSDVLHSIDGCRVLHPEMMDIIPALQDFTIEFGSRKGTLAFWLLRTETGLDVAVDGVPDRHEDQFVALADWARTAGIARLTVGNDVVVTRTKPIVTFGSAPVTPPPRGFTQATVEAEHFLQSVVSESLMGSAHILDLFSGCGTFGLPLAQSARVTAYEGDPDLISALEQSVRQTHQIKPVTAAVRDLFRNPVLATDLNAFDGIVIDPPRAGAEAQTAEISDSQVEKIAMVSCNPITFARDVEILAKGGYALRWVDVVDQFRWSPHVEVVAHLSR